MNYKSIFSYKAVLDIHTLSFSLVFLSYALYSWETFFELHVKAY